MIFMSLGADELGAAAGTSWSGPFTIAIMDACGTATGEVNGTVSATRVSVPDAT